MNDTVRAGWFDDRTPAEWRAYWQAVYDSVDGPESYWLAYRSYPDRFPDPEADSPRRWVDWPDDWDTVVRTLDLAQNSAERRFLMGDVQWAYDFVFPGWYDDVVRDEPKLRQLLALGGGDHAFRGELMWQLTHFDLVRPDEIEPVEGDLAEFVRRFPTSEDWHRMVRGIEPDRVWYGDFEDLPEAMQCAVGVLAFRDPRNNSAIWANRIADHRSDR